GLYAVAKLIDWDDNPEGLRQGDLSGLPAGLAKLIRAAAQQADIVALARTLGVDPVVVVIALIAREHGGTSRSAKRIARAVLGKVDARDLAAAVKAIGL